MPGRSDRHHRAGQQRPDLRAINQVPIDNVRITTAAWACEASRFANNPMPDLQEGLGELEIKAESLRYIVCAGQDLLADSSFNLETWIMRKVRDGFRRAISDAILGGDGVGKPQGPPESKQWHSDLRHRAVDAGRRLQAAGRGNAEVRDPDAMASQWFVPNESKDLRIAADNERRQRAAALEHDAAGDGGLSACRITDHHRFSDA